MGITTRFEPLNKMILVLLLALTCAFAGDSQDRPTKIKLTHHGLCQTLEKDFTFPKDRISWILEQATRNFDLEEIAAARSDPKVETAFQNGKQLQLTEKVFKNRKRK